MVDDITQMGNKIIKMQEGIANNEFLRGILKSTLGQTAFKALPKNLKPIVEKIYRRYFNGNHKDSRRL